jgi:hypothetical protein
MIFQLQGIVCISLFEHYEHYEHLEQIKAIYNICDHLMLKEF